MNQSRHARRESHRSVLLTAGVLNVAWMVNAVLHTTAYAQTTAIKLSATQLKTAGVTVASAQPVTSAATGNTLRLTGRVSFPNRGVQLVSASSAGQVQAVLVNVGDTIQVGTPLLKLYSAELVGLQRAYLQARSATELASQKLTRDEALLADGIIAQSRADETRISHIQAQATLNEQAQLLKLAGMSDSAINALRNASQINPVQTVSAQVNGLVLEQNVTPGERVDAGAALFKLGDTRTLWVELQATTQQLGQLNVGNRAMADGCAQSGKLVAISPQVSKDSQTALVRAEFANADNCLRPNQFAEVAVSTKGAATAVSIPSKALLRSGGKDYVFVQDKEGSFRQTEVSVLSRQGERVWLSAALPVGTNVAVTGIAALRGAASGLGEE